MHAVRRIAACILMPLAGACSNPFASVRDATLEISVKSGGGSAEWPRDQLGARTALVNGLDNPRGMAGFTMELAWPGFERAFTASDFADGAEPHFTVPDSGTLTLAVQLQQDSLVVAEGVESWQLEPEVEWQMVVQRAPYPASEGFSDMEDIRNPQCSWFWCFRNWRFAIAEDAANYEWEAIWITIYRVHPDEYADVC